MPEVKKQLRGGKFWFDRYYINTVGAHNSGGVMKSYFRNQDNINHSSQPSHF
jgi:REP element-mobilizing transposase RayT